MEQEPPPLAPQPPSPAASGGTAASSTLPRLRSLDQPASPLALARTGADRLCAHQILPYCLSNPSTRPNVTDVRTFVLFMQRRPEPVSELR